MSTLDDLISTDIRESTYFQENVIKLILGRVGILIYATELAF